MNTKSGKLATTILIVDDSDTDCVMYSRYLNSDVTTQYHILEAGTVKDALEIWQTHHNEIDVVLVDYNLPDGDGLELLEAVGKDCSAAKVPVIIIIAQENESIATSAIEKGAMDYLVKKDITKFSLCHSIHRLSEITTLKHKHQEAIKAIAIQQAELYKSLQTINTSLEQKVADHIREITASEIKFRAIFNNTFQFIGLLTIDGILLEANQTALDFGGLQLEDVINLPFWEISWWNISSETQDRLKQAIACAAQGEFIRYEVDVLGAGGQIITIDFSLRPLKNQLGEVIMLIPEGRDISDNKRIERERKEIEEALKESQQRYATLVASAPVGIYRTDAQGNCLYVNNQWCENTGLTSEEALGTGWQKALHPEDLNIIGNQWHHLVQTGETFSLEYRFQKPDGGVIWVFGQAVPEKDAEGTITGYVGTITNITDRKLAEEALLTSEQLYRTLVDNFPNGVVVLFDHDLRYLLVGGAGLTKIGLNHEEMEGKTVWEIFPPDVAEECAINFWQTLSGKNVIAEIPYADYLYLGHHIPVRDDQGNVIAGILMTQDITERKKAEESLRDSEERFRQFAENSRSVMLLRQLDSGELLYVNPAYEQIWGLTCESLHENPNSWMDCLHPDDRERIDVAYQETAGQGFLTHIPHPPVSQSVISDF
ncbi:PAS domain S-box protein [Dolichospermum sp. ST_sed1]|nr:PAS domain S-box protein [Dolichospermum sp. ST_sed1]MDD1423176.1 PAS domain S-box protein [Dolichospermum sp. ST_sed9]MDD1432811.1 PAS domain S-box protein [Dolichospermum sp. ST_sed6]MDD1449366.1 PAS domain S-box protein [Dolichospermum sp. ST_sed8]MDD1458091.1 PAS domain S-box protein [Dolichospermum sp. ST_sed7]MDD1463358.1 PAS domain S-box protein [Dolichospermum sp. ST_sed2]MDD1469092.1 PAS domain S-box protein [Dolichospermum sp. ST_sed5]MDD1474588.1 PAS domain S-box protein [Dolic